MKYISHGNYILDDQGNPVEEPDLLKWGRWFQESRDQRIVKQETVNGKWVSTVFLGLDHQWGKGPPPILWECMVFKSNGKWEEEDCDRCSGNREQAEAMHRMMVEKHLLRKEVS